MRFKVGSIVFFLVVFSVSITNAQVNHLDVVRENLQGTTVLQPLSELEKENLVGYLQDLKQKYVSSILQAEAHLDEVLATSSPELKGRIKTLVFYSGIMNIVGVDYFSFKSRATTEAEIFDRLIEVVQQNTGSTRSLNIIERRLSIIESRQDIVFQSINDILQNNVYLLISDLPFVLSETCQDDERFSDLMNSWLQVSYNRYNASRAEKGRLQRLSYGVRLDEKLIQFYSETPKIVCSSPSWYNINPAPSGIVYDANSHTFFITADRSLTPSYNDLKAVLIEQLNQQ